MLKVAKNASREHRIDMEIIVDAYNEDEQAMGWYYYLEETLRFPFKARSIRKRHVSPLSVGEEVEAVRMATEDECGHEMFVEVRWQDRVFSVPLSQLKAIKTDKLTQQGIEDWHYWVDMGYRF